MAVAEQEQVAPELEAETSGGLNPIVVAVVAFAAGMLLAKIVDWRGHAHPRV